MKKMISTGIALAAASLLVQPAKAQNASAMEERSTRVLYADLDLGKTADVAELNNRVRRAANALCLRHGLQTLKEMSQGRQCASAAIRGAQTQVAQAIEAQANRRFAATSIRVAAK